MSIRQGHRTSQSRKSGVSPPLKSLGEHVCELLGPITLYFPCICELGSLMLPPESEQSPQQRPLRLCS